MDIYLFILNIEFIVILKYFNLMVFFYFSFVLDDKYWQSFILYLIEKCICIVDIVFFVVMSLLFEGFMIYDSEGKYIIIDIVVYCV